MKKDLMNEIYLTGLIDVRERYKFWQRLTVGFIKIIHMTIYVIHSLYTIPILLLFIRKDNVFNTQGVHCSIQKTSGIISVSWLLSGDGRASIHSTYDFCSPALYLRGLRCSHQVWSWGSRDSLLTSGQLIALVLLCSLCSPRASRACVWARVWACGSLRSLNCRAPGRSPISGIDSPSRSTIWQGTLLLASKLAAHATHNKYLYITPVRIQGVV